MNPWGVIRFVQQSRVGKDNDTVHLASALAAESRILFPGDGRQQAKRNPCAGFAANLEKVAFGYVNHGWSGWNLSITRHNLGAWDAPLAPAGVISDPISCQFMTTFTWADAWEVGT